MIATDRTKEEIIKEINFLVEDKIQPSVAMHGGEVRLVKEVAKESNL